MASNSTRKIFRRVAFFGGGTVIAALAFGPLLSQAIGRSSAGAHGAKLVALGMKFDGAEACKGSGCHSKGDDTAPPTERGSENDIWANKDPHSKAFETLKNDESKAIGTKMSIADVTTSKDCLGCHAMDIPDNLKGQKFAISEGNTCVSCHGPSEKWLTPHAKKGSPWVAEQRKAHPDHDALLKATGLYDTRPPMARAELCAGCHLTIDAKMVAAGHPQPKFELDYYTLGNPKTGEPWKHWTTDKGGAEIAKFWLAGQAACARDAMVQLASRATANADAAAVKDAWEQAVAHGWIFAAAAKAAGVGDMSAAVEAVKAAKGDNAKSAAAATAAADAATKLFAAVDKLDPAAAGKPMLAAVAGLKGVVTDTAAHGHAQMAYSLYALARSIDGDEKAGELTGSLFPDAEKPTAGADFDKMLADVAGKLPK